MPKLRFAAALCCGVLMLPLVLSGGTVREGGACSPLAEPERGRIVAYVAKKYEIPATAKLAIKDESLVPGGCYRKLVLAGQGPLGTFSLTLYLSPDRRYLSPELLDSELDPEIEAREKAAAAMGQLLEGDFASRGNPNAPVTVVFFADFQCPFCMRAAELLKAEPLIKEGKEVRLVFRHMPLPNHSWAQPAAQAAACAQFQNAAAFWGLADALFANQSSIAPENFHAKVTELASHIPSLDEKQFSECVDRQMSLGRVLRDKELARRLGVDATPTFFINGRRTEGVPEAAELHALLEKALAEAKATPASSSAEVPVSK